MLPAKLYHKAKARLRYALNDLRKPEVKLSGDHILVFHGVDDYDNQRINSRFISAERLEKLLKQLQSNAKFVSIEDMYTGGTYSSQARIALTFDDGYRNNLTHLLPILERLQIPASIYITTLRTTDQDMLWTDCLDLAAYIDHATFELQGERFRHTGKKGYRSVKTGRYLKEIAKKNDWAYKEEMMRQLPGARDIRKMKGLDIYWKLLAEDDIRTLAKSPLITIGSHAQRHNCLAECSHEEAMDELRISRAYLENILQQEVKELAYPDGSYTEALGRDAAAMGFTRQLLGHFLYPESSSYAWYKERFFTNPHISPYNQMICIANQRYY